MAAALQTPTHTMCLSYTYYCINTVSYIRRVRSMSKCMNVFLFAYTLEIGHMSLTMTRLKVIVCIPTLATIIYPYRSPIFTKLRLLARGPYAKKTEISNLYAIMKKKNTISKLIMPIE